MAHKALMAHTFFRPKAREVPSLARHAVGFIEFLGAWVVEPLDEIG
jgi:hypothetical protein